MKYKQISEEDIKQTIKIYTTNCGDNNDYDIRRSLYVGLIAFIFTNLQSIKTASLAIEIIQLLLKKEIHFLAYDETINYNEIQILKRFDKLITNKEDLVKLFGMESIRHIQFPENFIDKHINELNGRDLLLHQNLSKKQIEIVMTYDNFSWDCLIKNQKLDMEFVKQYEENFDLKDILVYQDIDEEFYYRYKNKIISKLGNKIADDVLNRILNNPDLNQDIKNEIQGHYDGKQVAKKLMNAK